MKRSYHEMTLRELLDSLAQPTPTPGGGTAAALAGALGAALGTMALRIAAKKSSTDLTPTIETLQRISEEFLALADEDATAYEGVVTARKLPKRSPEEKARRRARIQEALQDAARVPLRTASKALELLEILRDIQGEIGRNLLSDLLVAARLAVACLHGALNNVDINCSLVKDSQFIRFAARRRQELVIQGTELSGEILAREEEIKDWLGEEDSNLH